MEPNDYAARHWGLKKRNHLGDRDMDSLCLKIQKVEASSTPFDQKSSLIKTGCKDDVDMEPV